jgi:hypothetical protein
MRWQVGIDGPDQVLSQVALAVSDRDIQLTRQQGTFFLCGSLLDSLDDVYAVRREAERIVAILSSAARLSLGSTELLRVGDVGESQHNTPAGSAIDLPPPIDRADHTLGWPRRSSLSRTVREALSNPAIETALRLRDAANLSWGDLLQICEIVERARGSRATAVLRGVRETLIGRPFAKADTRHVAGGAQRHATEAVQAAPPMTFEEARCKVDRLLMAWLGSTFARQRGAALGVVGH